MKTTVGKICEFYNTYPELMGKINVLTPNGFKKIQYADITAKNSSVTYIKTFQGKELYGSPNHRIMVNDKWTPLNKIKIGTKINTIDGLEEIEIISKLKIKEDLYDLQVADNYQYYSNGILSHNSAISESIPFAWFGKLSRPIKKESIINWQNKKNCEVTCSFKKGDNTYHVIRSIKPDKLEIYENETLIPIPSDVRTYQKQFEKEIIGMDYNTFMYLFYTNLNSNVPLLKMNTAQKRQFLEKMFLLDTYTELNTISNEKIKGIDEKIFKQTVIIDQTSKTISELEEQNSSLRLKLIDITPYENEIKELKQKYIIQQELLTNDSNDISSIEKYITFISTMINTLNSNINKIQSDISLLKADTISKEKVIKDIEKQKNDHNEKLKLVKDQLKIEDMVNSTELISTIEKKIEDVEHEIKEIDNNKNILSNNISVNMEKKRGLEETYNILKDGLCPTCNRKLTGKILNQEYIDKISKINDILEKDNKKLEDINIVLKNNIDSYRQLKGNLNIEREKIKKRDSLVVKLRTLTDIIIPSSDKEKNDIIENNLKIKTYTTSLESFIIKLDEQNNELIKNNQILDTIKINIKSLEDLSNNIKSLENEYELRKNNKDEILKIINDNDDKIKRIKSEKVASTSSINKLKDLVDYLSYLKVLCKDENVKQYAISSYMNYLIQQTNFYLSQSGSSHYLKFNKWLEEEIHGSGIFDASYGNLSGGESRSIDLAIQFAFLDVAKLRTGVFPDILLLDEILDSSIDSNGLSNILKIIQTKQYEDKSKVFIITHRTEITDMDCDNIYIVNKNKGFSTISKQ